MDDTRIDAAPTPAHIFAYRAFRSVFVGSPESSPIRPRPTEPQHTNDNKENTLRLPARGSRFTTSPVKSKRNAEAVPETLNLSLTPKKQRTNPVSPTKSILKKSNVPTPRRAELRDVTVTFKDIRMSASPEMARRGSPVRIRSQPDLRNTLTALSTVAVSAPVLKAVSTSQVEGSKKVEKSHVVPEAMTDADFDGYMAQTEKEIRRLIKYGQKWREYSRRQDVENARLKGLIEDLQKENERLRRKGDAELENVKPSTSTTATTTLTHSKPDAKLSKQRNPSFDLENNTRNKEPEKWKIPLDNFDLEESSSKLRRTLNKKPEEPFRDIPSTSKDTHKSQRPTASAANLDKEFFKHSSMHRAHKDNARPHREEVHPIKERIPANSAPQDTAKHVPDLSNPAPECSSEVDRKAAARERLRLKREAKVGSVRTSSAPVARNSRSGHDPLKEDNEESQVDWMALS